MVVVSAALLGCGVYLLLERSLSRVLVGLVMMGNGVSLAFLVAGGPAGSAPIIGSESGDASEMADPLPQAMVLTAIVITLATTAFVLAMAYRSWQLNGHDDVQDDVEDAAIRRMAATDVTSEAYGAASDDEDTDVSDDPRESDETPAAPEPGGAAPLATALDAVPGTEPRP
nr:Na(+)/H(+) antiporter subunit C [Nocardioides sp. zg-DK7169]